MLAVASDLICLASLLVPSRQLLGTLQYNKKKYIYSYFSVRICVIGHVFIYFQLTLKRIGSCD